MQLKPASRTTVAFGLLLGLAVGIFVGLFLPRLQRSLFPGGSVSRVIDPPSVVMQIRGLSQLVTVKYTIQKAVALEEQKVPFGAERLLLFVQAEVAAGLDLSHLRDDDIRLLPDGAVLVSLPPAEITSVEIDDKLTRVWDRSITWWTPWVPYNQDLERQARLEARKEAEKAARDMGILNQSRKNAEDIIRGLLMSTGAKDVKFLDRS
ncbi:MAG: DUF4230 domain-containing protein [Bryobacterales bacterium]|nr:DUF4230 domain-containing protein [Bryobacterales bacterium]